MPRASERVAVLLRPLTLAMTASAQTGNDWGTNGVPFMEVSESAFNFMFACSYARLHNAIHITFTEAEAKLEP